MSGVVGENVVEIELRMQQLEVALVVCSIFSLVLSYFSLPYRVWDGVRIENGRLGKRLLDRRPCRRCGDFLVSERDRRYMSHYFYPPSVRVALGFT